MKKRIFLSTVLAALVSSYTGVMAADTGVTFHFYGALDCPPCMAFKRNHLDNVRAEGQAVGFVVEDNITDRTRDVPNAGIYGDRDPILRLAAKELDLVYPPIFFVSLNGEVISVHAHDWRVALVDAKRRVEQGS